MIAVLGTDHRYAPLEVRSALSLTKEKTREVLEQLASFVQGAVVLSTCNRIEVYVSSAEPFVFVSGKEISLREFLLETLCGKKNVPAETVRDYFFYLENEKAADHLFHLTCGLESAILAEDQILTQVRHAREFAHDCYATDGVMELLFRMAVTAAKKVKTNVAFTRADASAVDLAVARLRESGFDFENSRCMVIGNGAYGKLAANTLVRTGAEVLVTVRQYHSGMLKVPEGCRAISYEARMEELPGCDLVISATASPHYTLKYEELKKLEGSMHRKMPVILIDLAVPPDIDPRVSELSSFSLTNIDDYKSGEIRENKDAWKQAEKILAEEEEKFRYQLESRCLAPDIRTIEANAQQDMHLRMKKIVKNLPMDPREQEKLSDDIDGAARRTVNKLIFDLQDYVDEETFRKCVEGMKKIYE